MNREVNIIHGTTCPSCGVFTPNSPALKPEWRDKPDSEGWWWFEYNTKFNPVYVHRDEAGILSYQARDGMVNPCEDLMSRHWVKAIVPEKE